MLHEGVDGELGALARVAGDRHDDGAAVRGGGVPGVVAGNVAGVAVIAAAARQREPGESAPGEGEGGGGGLYAAPLGVLEVSDAGTRFIGLNENRKLAGAALAGFCLGAFLARCRR